MKKILMLVAALCFVVPAAMAADGARSRLSIGLGQGVADGYSPVTVGSSDYLSPTTAPETNINVEYWYSFGDDYAFALSGAYGFSSMKWEGAVAGDPEIKATGTSFKVRVGGDRVASVGERLTVFMGPGLEFWTGKQKLDVGGSEDESESTTRFGVSGRIGGFMALSESVSIMGQVGHTFGIATAEDQAKSTWMPSSFNASWGLTFAF